MRSVTTLVLISWRSILAHASRLVMSVLTVVLGTAFVAGGFLLSASLNKAFTDLTESAYQDVDVVVSADDQRPLTDGDVAGVEKLPGVERALGDYYTGVTVLTPEGDPIQTGGAGAWLLNRAPSEQAVTEPTPITEGRAPSAADEALLNDAAAEAADITVGETITVIDAVGRTELTVVGLTHVASSTGGWAGVTVTTDSFRENFDHGRGYYSITVRATDGTAPEQLREDVAAALPDVTVQTGQEAADEQTRMIQEQLAFFTYILGAFGLIALLVGTFIISNTFSMTVGQRTRDFALLRAIGMSRRQLTGSVLVEALFTGLIGSALGILAGLGLVRLIQWAMDLANFGFPDGGLALTGETVGYPILVGVLVTLLSAYVPARRAGHTHPVQAMRGGESQTGTPVLGKAVAGALAAALGAGALILATLAEWPTTPRMVTTGAGAVLLLIGVRGMLPGFAKAFFSTTRVGSPVLRLAESSLSRNPGRTAGTVFGLTMGVTLVAAVTVLGASMSQSIYGAVEEDFTGDAVVATGVVSSQSIPRQVIDELEGTDGVDTVLPVPWGPLTVADGAASAGTSGGLTPILIADPLDLFDLTYADGSIDDPASQAGVTVDESTAEREGWSVGDELTVSLPDGAGSIRVPLLATLEDNAVGIAVTVTSAAATQLLPDASTWWLNRIYLSYSSPSAHEEVVELINSYGVLQIMDRQEFIESGVAQARQLLAIVYALLALSVVIAMLGVANTLGLSIIERTREIGSLRAVGMQRRQVQRMIMAESGQIALLGTVLGVMLGTTVGTVLSRSMSDVGITDVDVPWIQILAIAVGAALIGVLAGVMPARRAAEVSPLAAVE